MGESKGMSGHQSASPKSTTYITPPHIGPALGLFDLDPCEHTTMPWRMARRGYTINDNGLLQQWEGNVWMNPPYTTAEIRRWMAKLAAYGRGIALIHARTETFHFEKYVYPIADTIFHFYGRLYFHDETGKRLSANAGAPSVLISYGEENADRIADSGLKGKHLPVNAQVIVIVGISPSWSTVVASAIRRSNGTAALQTIYDLVELIAPDKVQRNHHYREKIRRTVQEQFERVGKGVYSLKPCLSEPPSVINSANT